MIDSVYPQTTFFFYNLFIFFVVNLIRFHPKIHFIFKFVKNGKKNFCIFFNLKSIFNEILDRKTYKAKSIDLKHVLYVCYKIKP